jgi:glycosyltransferase involved in cell wall biosynthesis
MRCPDLEDLPRPPAGATGWPWAERSPRLPSALPGRAEWPRISVVTPCLNRAGMVEETIRSVLLQDYPDLEYILIDGGSTDGTVDVVRRYERWLTFWVSEPDQGQSDALNKGFGVATGEVLAYLNADDIYMPGALGTVGRAFADSGVSWHSGRGRLFGPGVGWGYTWPRKPFAERWQWLVRNCLVQPSTFWRREAAQRVGPFNLELAVSMDHEYWLRLLASGYGLTWTNEVLSGFRVHPGSVTGRWGGAFAEEGKLLRRRYMAVLAAGDEHRVLGALAMHEARKHRWRAWRRAWSGEHGASLADLRHAARAAPRILLSPKTWAVLALVVLCAAVLKPAKALSAFLRPAQDR